MNELIPLEGRFHQIKTIFIVSVHRLQEAAHQPINDFMRDSVIKRFETTWETAWKLLKLWLSYQGVVASSPREVWKESFAIGILMGDADIWATAQRMRNLTVHTYDEDIAKQVHDFIRNDAIILFQDLGNKAKTWNIHT